MQQLLAITIGSNCLMNTSISRVMSTETVVETYLSFWLYDDVELNFLKQFNYLES